MFCISTKRLTNLILTIFLLALQFDLLAAPAHHFSISVIEWPNALPYHSLLVDQFRTYVINKKSIASCISDENVLKQNLAKETTASAYWELSGQQSWQLNCLSPTQQQTYFDLKLKKLNNDFVVNGMVTIFRHDQDLTTTIKVNSRIVESGKFYYFDQHRYGVLMRIN